MVVLLLPRSVELDTQDGAGEGVVAACGGSECGRYFGGCLKEHVWG